MKITVDNISEMFEGTKELLIGGLITAITGVLILIQVSSYEFVKLPLMLLVIFFTNGHTWFYGNAILTNYKSDCKDFLISKVAMYFAVYFLFCTLFCTGL
ncbi:hypothetical protein HH197_08185 [Citrobacter koseri]|uniref:hypothetical protein n=1 Tax=Citrobacter koseri TaxID=545 RepID=UPI0014634FC5|nr:hypothetical protein [Citrobacter koseri]QJI78247.1 hypothetical protein HH197_08185 [Citrobacter koseri]